MRHALPGAPGRRGPGRSEPRLDRQKGQGAFPAQLQTQADGYLFQPNGREKMKGPISNDEVVRA